jgi:biotin transporter BioY
MKTKAITSVFSKRIISGIRDAIFVFSFSILTGILAKLKIEIGPVPITFQTLAVLLSGAILGTKRGALSQIIYLLYGILGIPWFARGGGISYIFSPTFGYLLGFVFCAFLVGFLFERNLAKDFKSSVLIMILGNLILYLPGLLWLGKFVGFENVLKVGFYPFLIGDLLKIFFASLIYVKIFKKRSN